MADSMEEVTQRFEADMAEYVSEVERGAEDARSFARANEEAKTAVDGLRDHAAEAAGALGEMRREGDKAADAAGRFEALAAELGHVRDKALEAAGAMKGLKREEDSASRGGLLSRLLNGGIGSSGGGIPGALGPVPLPALIAIVPAIQALLVEASGLIAGFAAAGAGAGAFYLLAHPAITNLTGDVQALSSANQALGFAQQKYLIDPTKAHAKALQEAQLQYQAIYKQMGSDAGGAAAGVLKLHDTYVKLSDAFKPEAFKVINGFLTLANQLLPDIVPFAKTFADAISGLLGKASQFAGSKGFKDWLDQFHKLEGPSLTAIGDGIGKVVNAIGKFLTVENASDVVKSIGIAFNALAGAINAVTWVTAHIMHSWDELISGIKHSWYDIKRWTDDVTGAWDTVRHAAATLAHDTAAHFDEIRHDIAQWAGDVRHDVDRVIGWFRELPGRILAAVAGFGRLLWNAGVSLIQGLIGGITSMVGSVLSTIGNIGSGIVGSFKSVLGIGSPSRVFYQHGVDTMTGYINAVRDMAPRVQAAVRAVGGQVAGGGIGGAGGSFAGAAPSVHVSVPLTLGAGAQAYSDPRFLQYIQTVVQEAVLRYGLNNPGNGLALAGRL